MLKKFGMVGVGVTATLLAAAPLASAHGSHEGHDSHKSHSYGSHNGGSSSAECAIGGTQAGHGGDADGRSRIDNSGILGSVASATAGGVGGPAVGNVTTASCNNFLNHSLNDNFSGNHIRIADGIL